MKDLKGLIPFKSLLPIAKQVRARPQALKSFQLRSEEKGHSPIFRKRIRIRVYFQVSKLKTTVLSLCYTGEEKERPLVYSGDQEAGRGDSNKISSKKISLSYKIVLIISSFRYKKF